MRRAVERMRCARRSLFGFVPRSRIRRAIASLEAARTLLVAERPPPGRIGPASH